MRRRRGSVVNTALNIKSHHQLHKILEKTLKLHAKFTKIKTQEMYAVYVSSKILLYFCIKTYILWAP